jgi:hypothetical protein
MTDNFNLKKYLVENKVTTNSKMLTEAGEDPFSFLDKYITPVNDANPELVTKVKSMLDAYEVSELEQGIDTFGEGLLDYYMEYDQHWPGMPDGMANDLWDAKLLATVKAYKGGTMDIKKAVSQFRKILSNPRNYQGDGNRVTNNPKTVNENEEVPFSDNNLKKVVVAGTTYEVGSDDPNDEGIIIAIEKHPKGYFIMGQSGREGYGYGVDFEGTQVDQEEVM